MAIEALHVATVGAIYVTSPAFALVATGAGPLSFGFMVAVMSDRVHALQPIETIAATSFGAFLGLIPIVAAQPADAVIPADGRTWVLAISPAPQPATRETAGTARRRDDREASLRPGRSGPTTGAPLGTTSSRWRRRGRAVRARRNV